MSAIEKGRPSADVETKPFPVIIVSEDREVLLRRFIEEDAPAAFALIDRNRAHLSQFDERTSLDYPTVDMFEKSIAHPLNEDRMRFGIWNKEGDLVGSINLTPSIDRPDIGTIGYYLGKEHTGQGYTRRAVAALADHAFNRMGYTKLLATVHADNLKSQNVLRGTGFKVVLQNNNYKFFARHKQ